MSDQTGPVQWDAPEFAGDVDAAIGVPEFGDASEFEGAPEFDGAVPALPTEVPATPVQYSDDRVMDAPELYEVDYGSGGDPFVAASVDEPVMPPAPARPTPAAETSPPPPVVPEPATSGTTPPTFQADSAAHAVPAAPQAPLPPSVPEQPVALHPRAAPPPRSAPTPTPAPQPLPSRVEPVAETNQDYPPSVVAAATTLAVDQLRGYLADDECSEIVINGPQSMSRKIRGTRFECEGIDFGTVENYHATINDYVLALCDTSERIDYRNVLVEGQLSMPVPSGGPDMLARVHVIAPPAVNEAKVTIAKKPRQGITLAAMAESGSLTMPMMQFFQAITRGRANIVISGATGSGKSTFLQSLTHHFDSNDRVIVIEETPELTVPLGDVVYLRSTVEKPGMGPDDIVTLEWLVKQANRMRMDRVIVGETRGPEMSEWLIAANSGAEGSATTLHASSTRRALDKILSLASKSGYNQSEDQLRRDIAAAIDFVVQVAFVDGRYVVSAVEEITNTVSQATGQIQSSPIFVYDRVRGTHIAKNRPGDEFLHRMEANGSQLDPSWFMS